MKMKGIVKMIYDRNWQRNEGRWVPLTKTIPRQVGNIEPVELDADEINETIHGFTKHEFEPGWEEKVQWKLFRGSVKFQKREIPVYSWTFDDHAPLFWAGSIEPLFPARSSAIWYWIALLEWDEEKSENLKFVFILRDYWKQPAYQYIKKYLGADAFDQEWEILK